MIKKEGFSVLQPGWGLPGWLGCHPELLARSLALAGVPSGVTTPVLGPIDSRLQDWRLLAVDWL